MTIKYLLQTPPRSHTPQTQQVGAGGAGGQMLMPAPMGSMGPVGPGMAGAASPGQGGLSLMPVVHYVQANPGVPNQGPAGGGGGANPPQFSAHNPGAARFRKRK